MVDTDTFSGGIQTLHTSLSLTDPGPTRPLQQLQNQIFGQPICPD